MPALMSGLMVPAHAQVPDVARGELTTWLAFNELCIQPEGGLGAWNHALIKLVTCGTSTPPDQYNPSYFWATHYIARDTDGVWVQIVNQGHQGTRLCLDLTNGNTADGTPIQLYECRSTTGQYWKIEDNGRIRNWRSDKCLDVQFGDAFPGATVQNYHCADHGGVNFAQRWSWK